MKRRILPLLLCMALAACKKETVTTETTTETMGDTTVKTEVTTTVVDTAGNWDRQMAEAKTRLDSANVKLKEAIAKGDKKSAGSGAKSIR
jgi:hypothetical protein